jgi:two-component system, chemotaxis family, protein-glutamate methylesterase/glutaminase
VIPRKIKVLVVDDSAVVRRVLSDAISKEADLEVIGTAPDPYVARDKILALAPDVLTLDIEMPRMDGLTFLGKLMHFHPLPVVVISSVGQASCDVALEAIRLGAVEVLAKPSGPYSVGELGHVLGDKIRAAFAARLRKPDDTAPAMATQTAAPPVATPVPFRTTAGLIAIGASTGGTQAIEEVLLQIPEQCPPILIAQHIPPVFSASFATRLNSICRMEVKEAKDGDLVSPGRALVAPGNFHMTLVRRDGVSRVAVADGPRVHYQRPAVDVLFHSIAEARVPKTVGVLLTGMGSDGARGLLEMRQSGAFTIAQDEASCVVFGMPKVAIEQGAAQKVVPLSKIASQLMVNWSERPERASGA